MEKGWTLFMDRDGVVNEQIIGGYVMDTEQFVFHNGVFEALEILHQLFDRVLLVTNQQCVGKGLCPMSTIDHVHEWMQQQLVTRNVAFDKIYCCPHLAAEGCNCRKPQPGMALQAQRDFPDIDFSHSVMVGDSLTDIQFAQNAGVRAVHVGAIRHPEFEEIQKITPLHYDSLFEFAQSLGNSKFQVSGSRFQEESTK